MNLTYWLNFVSFEKSGVVVARWRPLFLKPILWPVLPTIFEPSFVNCQVIIGTTICVVAVPFLAQLSIMGATGGPERDRQLIWIYFTNENPLIRLIGFSNSWRARILPADFSSLQARTAVSLFVGLSNYWEGPTILVLLLAISRKGPLKCLLGGPRSRGSRFLGPSYRRRRPRRPISLDFSGLGWLFIEPQHMI